MRTDQIHVSQSTRYGYLAAAYSCPRTGQRRDDRVFAVPQLPGCAERSRLLGGTRKLLERGSLDFLPQQSPYSPGRLYRRQ